MVAVGRKERTQCLLIFTKFHALLHLKVFSCEGFKCFRVKAQPYVRFLSVSLFVHSSIVRIGFKPIP